MEKLVYRFNLDCNHIGIQRTIQGLQSGEILARECVIGLVHGSTPIELPTDNSVVAVMYVTRDGVTDVKSCTLDTANSTVTYEFAEEDLANAGIVTMQLKLIQTRLGGAERVLFAPKFELEIEQSDADEGDAEDTPTFTALETALAQAQSVYNSRIVSVTVDEDHNLIITYADGTTYESDAIPEGITEALDEILPDVVSEAVDEKFAETLGTISGYVTTAQTAAHTAENQADRAAYEARDASESAYHAGTALTGAQAAQTAAETAQADTEDSMQIAQTSAQDAETSASNAEESADEAEAWANGERNGVPVTSSDPTYHHNAKWYMEQASQIVGGEDLVKYTVQSDKTAEAKAIARTNIGAMASADKGVANGVASLDNNGRIPYSQLPESAMEYKGMWNASTNTPTLEDGVGTNGDFYIVSVAGTWEGTAFSVDDRIIYDGTLEEWHRLGASHIVDNLDSTSTDSALSANQGRVLKGLIENVFVIKEGEEVTANYIESFSDGYHRLKGAGAAQLYEQFPIDDQDAYHSKSTTLFVHHQEDFVRAELYYESLYDEFEVYILPWFYIAEESPTSADWVMVFGGASVSSGTGGNLASYSGSDKIVSSGINAMTVVQANAIDGKLTKTTPLRANATAVSDETVACFRNIRAGTTDLTAGTSTLASGDIYFVYE